MGYYIVQIVTIVTKKDDEMTNYSTIEHKKEEVGLQESDEEIGKLTKTRLQ